MPRQNQRLTQLVIKLQCTQPLTRPPNYLHWPIKHRMDRQRVTDLLVNLKHQHSNLPKKYDNNSKKMINIIKTIWKHIKTTNIVERRWLIQFPWSMISHDCLATFLHLDCFGIASHNTFLSGEQTVLQAQYLPFLWSLEYSIMKDSTLHRTHQNHNQESGRNHLIQCNVHSRKRTWTLKISQNDDALEEEIPNQPWWSIVPP